MGRRLTLEQNRDDTTHLDSLEKPPSACQLVRESGMDTENRRRVSTGKSAGRWRRLRSDR